MRRRGTGRRVEVSRGEAERQTVGRLRGMRKTAKTEDRRADLWRRSRTSITYYLGKSLVSRVCKSVFVSGECVWG
jgi:hypothetical protein